MLRDDQVTRMQIQRARPPRATSAATIALIAVIAVILLVPSGAVAATSHRPFGLKTTLGLLPHLRPGGRVLGSFPVPGALAWDPGTGLLDVVEAGGLLVAVNGSTGALVHQTRLGGSLAGVAIDPLLDRVYVADSARGLLDVVAGTTGTLLARVPVGLQPIGVAFDAQDGFVYVANSGGTNLTQVAPGNNTVVGSVPGGTGASWIAVDTQSGHLFVSDTAACPATARGCNVTVVDPGSGAIVATVRVGNSPAQLLYDPQTDRVFIAVAKLQRVTVLDAATNTRVAFADVGMGHPGNPPSGLALDNRSDRVYVATPEGIVEIDAATANITNDTPAPFLPAALAYAPSLNEILAADGGSAGGLAALVHTFAPDTQLFGGTFVLTDPVGPVLYNGFNHRMYVEDAFRDRLDVLNASTRAPVATIPGVLPGAMTYDPADGSVYVAQGTAIAVFNASTFQRVALISDPRGVIGLTFDGRNQELFAADTDQNISVIDVRTNTTVGNLTVPNLPFSQVAGPNGAPGSILQMVYDARSNRLVFVTSGICDQYGASSWNMSEINPVSLRVVATSYGWGQAGTMLMDPLTGEFYLTFIDTYLGQPTDWVSAFNVSTLGYSEIPITGDVNSISYPGFPFDEPTQGIGWARPTGDLYVTNVTGTMFRINVMNGTVDTLLVGGPNPAGSVFDPLTGKLWVPHPDSGAISIVDP